MMPNSFDLSQYRRPNIRWLVNRYQPRFDELEYWREVFRETGSEEAARKCEQILSEREK